MPFVKLESHVTTFITIKVIALIKVYYEIFSFGLVTN